MRIKKRMISLTMVITFAITVFAGVFVRDEISVYATDPEVTLGSEALKTNAGQSGAQKVLYGGRSGVVIAYKGKNGSGNVIRYQPEGGDREVSLYRANTITLLQDSVTGGYNKAYILITDKALSVKLQGNENR